MPKVAVHFPDEEHRREKMEFAFAPREGDAISMLVGGSPQLYRVTDAWHRPRADAEGAGYHCHGGGAAPVLSRSSQPQSLSGGGSFRNCSAARAAGAAPVRRGDPGYGRHLDRDGDGVGCE